MKKCPITTKSPAIEGTTLIRFANAPTGNFAILILHDENDDGRLNMSSQGIPIEGFGFSRGAIGNPGPPKFGDATVMIKNGMNNFTIDLNY